MWCLTQCVGTGVRIFDLTTDRYFVRSCHTSSEIALLSSGSSVSGVVVAEVLLVCFLPALLVLLMGFSLLQGLEGDAQQCVVDFMGCAVR